MGSGAAEDQPVARFAVLERRNVKVTVHPVAYKSPVTGSVLAMPQDVPDAEDLEQYLDLIYGPQANVYFEVEVRPVVEVSYDVGVGETGGGQPEKGKENGWLDVCYAQAVGSELVYYASDEETLIKAASHDATATVNVYLVATASTTAGIGLLQATLASGQQGAQWWVLDDYVLGFAGKARPLEQGILWVWDYPISYSNGQPDRPHHYWTIAHEIGHYIGRLQHSDIKPPLNPAYVPNSDSEVRLLTGKAGPKRNGNPARLVKPEWDLIQTRLKQIENGTE
ncbi:MAG TPA: hypothetical protein VD994_18170 [Prosthecobacter sp.]|nr:hypothetical protein [Prosthecobacter sp.]